MFTETSIAEAGSSSIDNPTLLIACDRGAVRTAELEQFRVHVPHGEIEHLKTGHLVGSDTDCQALGFCTIATSTSHHHHND